MCKAINYANELVEILNNIENERNELRQKLNNLNLAEQDLLHKAENEILNIVQGYDIYRGLHDIRNARRVAKNELETLDILIATSNNTRKNIIKTKETLVSRDTQLNIILKHKIYHSRKLNLNNDIRIEIKSLLKAGE